METIDPVILNEIESRLPPTRHGDVPRLLTPLSLPAWGQLVLEVPEGYPKLKALIPPMPAEAVQDKWTGAHGAVLMAQTLAFMNTLVEGYTAVTGQDLMGASVLDYGCGWGRHIRLLYKYVDEEDIYAVDPWEPALMLCRLHGLRAHLAQSEEVPTSLPFERQFKLIYAFSVFTHLSADATHTALNTLRRYLAEDGVLVISLRPPEFWNYHQGGAYAEAMLAEHQASGYAFRPHPRPPLIFGDTSISLDYLAQNFPNFKLAFHQTNPIDPFQVVVFLRGA